MTPAAYLPLSCRSPVWLADSFLLGFSAVSACIMMVCMAFASVATRFSEWGFGGHFRCGFEA